MKGATTQSQPPANIQTQTIEIQNEIRMTVQRGIGGAQVKYEPTEQTSHMIEIGFNLGGPIQSVLYSDNRAQAQVSNHGQAHIAFYPGCSGLAQYCKGQPVCYLSFIISISLFEYYFDTLIMYVKEQMQERKSLCHTIFSPITADMKFVLQQMMLCPVQNKAKGLFYEGKALELVSYLRQTTNKERSCLKLTLTDEDREKMWEAKSILDDSIESPPSVQQLSQLIGVNEFKLKNGFRLVHGITPYRYLADQRLEKARNLLCEQKMNVSEVAFEVGYSSLSHFSKIFRSKYGVSPHEYMSNAGNI
ncbi:helix-turn-helix domain-containing protein [Pseudodesulfovibrio sp. F-1]|uniref:Helix-turn-helix domain-containing protein n=1 Tax=Pseudodesulfovibrio alkaliphilus TaxID=2661613 RepID=A0A7K1KS82_9BACT|nr:AraC family transcriptional regulator [Pseudodesulfovibrio alkaliphilus]MUM78820.1 helix-turn-helix domain-containing protein [Pseudodesulfovibrio alkaliphilus]